MSASFFAVAFLAAVVLVNWRLVLLIIASCIVALIAFGIGVVTPEPPQNSAPAGTVQVDPAISSAGDVGQPPPR